MGCGEATAIRMMLAATGRLWVLGGEARAGIKARLSLRERKGIAKAR